MKRTGAAINPRFIAGLDEPDGLTVSGNTLFVSSFGSGMGSRPAPLANTTPAPAPRLTPA